MICAHTVRRLKPGAYDEFITTFMPTPDEPPRGWVRFHALRNLADPDQVVTFGFFDGTLEEMEAAQAEEDFAARRDAIAPFVEAVVVNGVYEITESRTADDAAG